LNGNGSFAVSASPSQQEIADQRDIIVKSDWFLAMRAVRARPDNRLLFRQPANADIQKAANHSPEDDRNNVPHISFLNAWREAHSA